MSKNDRAYGVTRLKSKNARNAIIQHISEDFNLMPIMAEAYFNQVSTYFQQHANISLKSGQICYEAVAESEPAGKHIALARKVSCKLTLNDPLSDYEVLAQYGLAGLRRHRLLRITREALDQGAVLSYEDIAIILTTSPATVRRDARYLRKQGKLVVTRGWKQDMGPGISHKTQIIEMYLKGYTFTDVEQRTNHSEKSVARYLRDFTQVITLKNQNFSPAQIRQVTGFSQRLVNEYLDIFTYYNKSKNERLELLLNPKELKKTKEQK
jgi:hypothetical protein